MLRSDQNLRATLASGLADISAVRAAEYATILERRRRNGEPDGSGADGAPERLFGVCLSGGGIRSASFCLGALQALDQYGLIRKLDYLSTVSGGGYAGASLAAAMGGRGEPFPFSSSSEQGQDKRDSKEISHIRDHSRFLAPNGFPDLMVSFAIALRGLVVNLILLLAVLVGLAAALIAFNPTVADLGKSFLWDTVAFWLPGSIAPGTWKDALRPYLMDSFLMTKATGCLLLLSLLGWALRRSYVEMYDRVSIRRLFEPGSRWATVTQALLLSFVVAVVIEIQPIIVGWMVGLLKHGSGSRTGLLAGWGAIASIIGATAAFRGTLASWIQKALGSPTIGAQLRAALAKIAFYAAGLALPLMIYGLFLAIVIAGIRGAFDADDSPVFRYLASSDYVTWVLLGALVLFIVGRRLVRFFLPAGLVTDERPILATIRSLWSSKAGRFYLVMFAAWAVVLVLALVATRADPYATTFRSQIFDRQAIPEWKVLADYALFVLLLSAIGMSFAENANGLHRLYRDRLSRAFKLHGGEADGASSLLLHELRGDAPYLLVNGTLNVRRSSPTPTEQPSTEQGEMARADPAKRGRNAELFLFSRHFVGSDTTGYLSSELISEAEPQLDLATATAISGAAVSSSMGRFNLGLLGPTLALLNLRLGYWLINPRYVHQQRAEAQKRQNAKDTRRWDEILRLYLFNEAFGRMRADSPKIYITDGGHIENLGLYQLLKRRCKLVIVIDSEADAGMTFRAFSDAQRFARIDEGVRVSLDWRPVRDGALKRLADKQQSQRYDTLDSYKHYAIGKIVYEDDSEGLLIYVKASVTGDEPDYVLDYERRNPLFPHESTGDQFFSEEQMEAYRSLGFHILQRVLDDETVSEGTVAKGKAAAPERKGVAPGDGPQAVSVRRFKEALGIQGMTLDGQRRKQKGTGGRKRRSPEVKAAD